MSSFGTSVINKSAKKYTPKAPARRNRPAKAPTPPPTTSHSSHTESTQATTAASQEPIANNATPVGIVPPENAHTDTSANVQVNDTSEAPTDSQIQEDSTETTLPQKRTRGGADDETTTGPRKKQRVEQDPTDAQPEPRPTESSSSNAQLTSIDTAQRQTSSTVNEGANQADGANQEIPAQSIRQRVAARAKARKQARQAADDRAAQEASHQVARASVNDRSASGDNTGNAEHFSTPQGSGDTTSNPPVQQQTAVSQAPSNNTPQSENATQTQDAAPTNTTAKKKRGRPRKNATGTPSNSESLSISQTASARAGELSRSAEHNTGEREASTQQADPDNTQSNTSQPKRKKKSSANRKSHATAADGENHEIDSGVISMNDLSKDSRRGKISGLETRMQNVDWGKVIAQRKAAEREALERAAAAQENQQNGDNTRAEGETGNAENPAVQGDDQAVNDRLDRAEAAAADSRYAGPRIKIVDGQMVIDDSTRTVDRYAENPEVDAATGAALEEIEEDDITRRINRQSWLHASRRDPLERRVSNKSDPWTDTQTNSFYDALRMFGTDFYIISRMFVGKTRRHIKLKFNREEKSNPERIRAALMGGNVPMDMAVYQQRTGKAEGYYKDPEILKRELAEADERQRAEIEKQKEEEREAARKKMEAARERQEAAKRGRRGRRKEGNADTADVAGNRAGSVQAAA